MKNNYKLGAIAFIALLGLTTLGIFVTRQDAQDKTQQQVNQQEQDDPPTVIKLGVMSEKQRKNSRKYNRSLEVPSLIAEDRDVLRGVGESFIAEDSFKNTPSQEEYFKKLGCQSNTIVTGKVKNKLSQLSEDNKSIFTDYDFEVLEIIKNNSPFLVNPKQTIIITRSGGVVKFNNRRIEVVNMKYKRLKIGKDYMLFLDYLSDSESFIQNSSEGAFEIQPDKKLKRLKSKQPPYKNNTENIIPFLQMVNTLIQQCNQ